MVVIFRRPWAQRQEPTAHQCYIYAPPLEDSDHVYVCTLAIKSTAPKSASLFLSRQFKTSRHYTFVL